jgi:hypothetical protein
LVIRAAIYFDGQSDPPIAKDCDGHRPVHPPLPLACCFVTWLLDQPVNLFFQISYQNLQATSVHSRVGWDLGDTTP